MPEAAIMGGKLVSVNFKGVVFMKKFSKRKMALMLACASFLTHGPKPSAFTKNQKIMAGVGGGLVLTIMVTTCILLADIFSYNGNFDLSKKGKAFRTNPILDIDVTNLKKDTLCRYLKELCEKADIKAGISVDDNQDSGWKQSAWEYIFVKNDQYKHSNMYDNIDVSDYQRGLLAKCIMIMYKNKDNELWNDVVKSNIINLSSHGGHCDWRFVSLIYSLYHSLLKFMHDKGLIKFNDPMEQKFAFFKEAIVDDLMPMALEYAKKKEPYSNEHVSIINKIMRGFEYLIGVPFTDIRNIELEYGKIAFTEMMKYENLIQVSHKMIDALDSEERKEILDLMNESKVSFKEFCKYTMKSKEQIKNMIKTINDAGDSSNELKKWVKGECSLGAWEIVENLIDNSYFDGLKKFWWGVAWVICCIKNGYLVPKGF